jgi:hypothetical protein
MIVPENKKFPADSLSQAVKNVASWLPEMFVHETSASDEIEPPDAAAKAQALRVVSVAAFAVPFAPGSPTCNFTYTFATEKLVAFPTESRSAFER